MGTIFCGDEGGEMIDVLADDKAVEGEGVLGKVSAMLLKVDETFDDETATRLLNLDGTIGDSSAIECCCIGKAVPIGIDEFAIDINGRYGATEVIGLETVFGGEGMLFMPPDMFMMPFASFSKFRKSSVSFVVSSESP